MTKLACMAAFAALVASSVRPKTASASQSLTRFPARCDDRRGGTEELAVPGG
jgi:hypothetical protein